MGVVAMHMYICVFQGMGTKVSGMSVGRVHVHASRGWGGYMCTCNTCMHQ